MRKPFLIFLIISYLSSLALSEQALTPEHLKTFDESHAYTSEEVSILAKNLLAAKKAFKESKSRVSKEQQRRNNMTAKLYLSQISSLKSKTRE